MKNKRFDEIKHGVLYMAEQLGTEQKIRPVFALYEASGVNNKLSEQQIRTQLFKIAVSKHCAEEVKNALYHFDRLPKKRSTEDQTRRDILTTAIRMGVDREQVLQIFSKYDNLLKSAHSEQERQQISYMGAAELHRLLGVRGPLVMDGKEIIPAQVGFDESEVQQTKFVKLD